MLWVLCFAMEPASFFYVDEEDESQEEKMAVTGKKAGKAASKVLRSGSTGKTSKTAAASALRQRPRGKKK